MKKFLGILILGVLICNFGFADYLKVIDGDTIIFNDEKIRFSGIDTPELKQICSKESQKIFCGMLAKKLLIKKIGDEIPKCVRE